MKNLLKLTVLALTVVLASCTNYDDQFANLESQIAALKTQVEGFSTLSSGLSTLQGTVTSLQAAVAALPTSTTDISGLTAGLTAAQTSIDAINAAIATLADSVATGNTSTAAAADAITALQADLTAVQADVASILASNNVYTGDVAIRNAAELAFAKQLAGKVAIINGDVYVEVSTANALSATEVSAVTKLITTVVGDVAVVSNAELDFSALTSVSGKYIVIGKDIKDDSLTNVGSAYLDYDGSYSVNFPSAVNLYIGTPNKATTVDLSKVTTNTSFNTVSALSASYDGTNITATSTNTTATLNTGDAVTVTLGSGIEVTEVSASVTTTAITLNSTVSPSTLSVTASKAVFTSAAAGFAGQVTATVKSFVAASATKASAKIDINADSFDLSKLATADDITITLSADGDATFAALKSAGDIVLDGVKTGGLIASSVVTTTSIDAPKVNSLTAGSLISSGLVTATVAKSITLGNISNANLSSAASATTFILTAQAGTFDTSELTDATSVDITGTDKTATLTIDNATVLATASVKGKWAGLDVSGTASLTTLITAGNIDSFTLSGTTTLAGVSLGHAINSGGASTVKVYNNAKLASLTTSTDYMNVLAIVNNDALTSFDLSSYQHKLLSGNSVFTVNGNAKIVGSFVAPTAATSSTAYVEASLTQASLATAKTFVTATASGSIVLAIDLDHVYINGSTTTVSDTLDNVFTSATVSSSVISHTSGDSLDSEVEYTLIKA